MKLFRTPKTRSMYIIGIPDGRCVAREAFQRALAVAGA
jgi:hypothetical protein